MRLRISRESGWTRLDRVEPVVVLIFFAVFLGALSQRVTGMGFGLVSGPFLVLLLDPFSGVILVNICGIVASFSVFVRTFAEVAWPPFRHLALGAVIGAVAGALLSSSMPTPPLQILIGALIIVSLISSLTLGKLGRSIPANFGTRMTAGLFSGAMSAAAGAGGPAVSAYAVLTNWEQRSFAATLQPFLVVGNVSAVVMKVVVDGGAWPHLEIGVWAGLGLVLVAGLLGGDRLARHIDVGVARIGMLVLAFGGGIAALVKGFLGLV